MPDDDEILHEWVLLRGGPRDGAIVYAVKGCDTFENYHRTDERVQTIKVVQRVPVFVYVEEKTSQ